MRVIYLFLLFSLHFSSYEFSTGYLKSVSVLQSYSFQKELFYSQNLLQIFSPFNQITVNTPNLYFPNVLQAGFIVSKYTTVSISIKNSDYITIWYRIIDAKNIINFDPKINSLNLKINRNSNDSYLSVQFYTSWLFSNNAVYQLWVVPIFPTGQFQSWSGEYSSRIRTRIIPVLNSSIDDDYLQNNGVLLDSNSISKFPQISRNLINRNLYTYLIIVQIKFNNTIKLQLNPAIIYGCLSKSVFSSTNDYSINFVLDGQDSCKLNLSQAWFYITCVALAFIILLILCGYLLEKTQIFYSSWMITMYFSCVGYHYLIGNLYESDVSLYVIIFPIGIVCAFAFTIIFSLSCKEGNFLRMFFNACCITLIILSVVFFGSENHFGKEIYVYIGIGVIGFVLLIFLLVCHGFTLTFGSTFIGITLMCLGFSILTVDSSAIPFLFSDFFNYILNAKFDVYYYSFFLKNDIIILSFWAFLTLFFGIIAYRSRRDKNSKKQRKLVEPVQITMEGLTPAENNIEINVYTNSVENFHVASTFTRPPPKYSSIEVNPQINYKPTAPTIDITPPPYPGLI